MTIESRRRDGCPIEAATWRGNRNERNVGGRGASDVPAAGAISHQTAGFKRLGPETRTPRSPRGAPAPIPYAGRGAPVTQRTRGTLTRCPWTTQTRHEYGRPFGFGQRRARTPIGLVDEIRAADRPTVRDPSDDVASPGGLIRLFSAALRHFHSPETETDSHDL